LLANNRLAPLGELITRTEIGARKDDGQIAYPESASFVQFLIETHGKERFLHAYSALENSDKGSVHRSNAAKLERIYEKALSALEKEWRSTILRTAPSPTSPPSATVPAPPEGRHDQR
jgi:hypothetical protein